MVNEYSVYINASTDAGPLVCSGSDLILK